MKSSLIYSQSFRKTIQILSKFFQFLSNTQNSYKTPQHSIKKLNSFSTPVPILCSNTTQKPIKNRFPKQFFLLITLSIHFSPSLIVSKSIDDSLKNSLKLKQNFQSTFFCESVPNCLDL